MKEMFDPEIKIFGVKYSPIKISSDNYKYHIIHEYYYYVVYNGENYTIFNTHFDNDRSLWTIGVGKGRIDFKYFEENPTNFPGAWGIPMNDIETTLEEYLVDYDHKKKIIDMLASISEGTW